MEKLLLVGSGGLGRVAMEIAAETYNCSFLDDAYAVGSRICGVEVAGHICDLRSLYGTYRNLIVTIGDNALRERIYRKAGEIGYQFPSLVSRSTSISRFAQVGGGCIFLQNVCIQNGSHVGDGVVLNAGVEVHHDSFVDDYALIYTNSVVRTGAKVGKRVKIGSCVTIANGARAADGIVIGDGSVFENADQPYHPNPYTE